MQTFDEVVAYLFAQLPVFQRDGAAAYKKDIKNTQLLCDYLGNPQNKFKSIHIAGTNGKGSTSHALSAVMQKNGYKTGLYTSPHLKSFTERIKIDGQEVQQQFVVDFVNTHRAFIEEIQPSFFEITVAMAFDYFAKEKVDVAIIETGMGGRLDSTNIISPELSIITNIGKDHTQFLGETLELIAAEKAGIIKPNTPVIVGEVLPATKPVFERVAKANNAPLLFAEEKYISTQIDLQKEGLSLSYLERETGNYKTILSDLRGIYQAKNMATVCAVINYLHAEQLINIDIEKSQKALSEIVALTGLKGRWQTLQELPYIICDTGHNAHGIRYILEQIAMYSFQKLHIVLGFVNDKSIDEVLQMFPTEAQYYFTQANIPRALQVNVLAEKAGQFGLEGLAFQSVEEAVNAAKKAAHEEDFIFIGGSTFVVAELDI